MNFIMHIIVSLTFGLASPVLGVVIMTCILTNVLLTRILVGRLWHIDPSASAPTEVSNDIHGILTENQSKSTSSRNLNDMAMKSSSMIFLVSEQRDVKEAWKAVFANGDIMIIAVTLFWAFLFFDMIADSYGWETGLISSCSFIAFLPSCAYASLHIVSPSWSIVKWLKMQMISYIDDCNERNVISDTARKGSIDAQSEDITDSALHESLNQDVEMSSFDGATLPTTQERTEAEIEESFQGA